MTQTFQTSSRRGTVAVGLLAIFTFAGAQTIRVATWNVSLYTGGRAADIQNAVYGSFQGRSFSPDVILGQEIQSASAANSFVGALNTAAGGPGDWAVTFGSLTGTSSTSDTALFYRTSKVSTFGAPVKVAAAGGTSGQPRDTWRFDIKVNGDGNSNEVLAMYDVHMKAGDASGDIARRQIEAQNIRNDSNTLASNYQFLIGGDMNVQTSSQAPYQTLVGSTSNNRGRFGDPIKTPGSWNNNSAYRFVHTQDPSNPSGGMDDRHDQLLLGSGLFDGVGMDYVGDSTQAYSTTTWNDPNHSYRAWGNDGTSFNTTLTTTGNTMVGASIAQSLINVATPAGGHLPVFLDLKYSPVPEPASIAALALGVASLLRRRRKK